MEIWEVSLVSHDPIGILWVSFELGKLSTEFPLR
jgi:hypothetical protein